MPRAGKLISEGERGDGKKSRMRKKVNLHVALFRLGLQSHFLAAECTLN